MTTWLRPGPQFQLKLHVHCGLGRLSELREEIR
ncbi:hypothetical protein SAMN05216215_1011205 [Saccharopolyspora shandongensis]|uniref:Uncharacterized protein n=1 Tax=Saccharopolyspora shandongensis TaxID=418495 RepID=A0A1H3C5G7_9PSEU|nr:hypothetical protein SAMN05216215_1011205 [Saccharopolyspora shandongensis]